MEVWEKSETVDPEVRAYLYSLVNAVGGSSTYNDTYAIGDDALAALTDIVRWLKLYDEKLHRYDVKRCLAEANLVKGDLLEILALWPEDATEHRLKSKLALACLQLLVPLTWPFELDEDKFTVNNHRHLPYLQLAQVGYKRAILHYEHAKILRSAVRIALPAMAQTRRERTKRDEGIVKLVLYLLRNMALITQPQHLPSQGDENETSRSSTINAFQDQHIFHFLLTIGSGTGDEFQEQDVVLLEILFHILKGVDSKKLFMENEQVAEEETNELKSLMQKERAMLSSYNKHAPTRHNRFGTMIWVQRDDAKMSTVSGQTGVANESTALQQMDASKKWNKPKYRGKLSSEFSEQSDFRMQIDLSSSARRNLRHFIESFLDSSFNPLFASLRKAIERETDRVQEMHHRQYFYLVHWFLSAESARRDQSRVQALNHPDRAPQMNAEENAFAYIAAVLDQETFVLLNRHMQRAFDEKSWQNLEATLLCFTQILLTVQSMSESKDEEDQEIAENIQSRIFYEESMHDRIVQILRGYSNQGFAYLDTITECVHVFVRMLERYSKQNVDLQIRSKRRARNKRRQQSNAGGDVQEDADEEAEDEREAHLAVSERKFDFARFSAKFLSQGCVDTFISLIHFHRDLSPSQLKRCHRFLYRLAFKHELAILLFRVDILQLFHRMIKGPDGMNAEAEGFKDWEQLIQQVFRRCIKWIERQTNGDGWKEMAVVEMLFSKVPNTLYYLQNGYERVAQKRPPRAPAELVFKSAVEEEQRVGAAVSLLIERGKADVVSWAKKELLRAADEREAWADSHVAEPGLEEQVAHGSDAVLSSPSIFITPDNDERKQQMFSDKHLRLLLTTLKLQRLGTAEDSDAPWIVPSDLAADQLRETVDQLSKAEFDPPTFEDGKTAEDLIRSKSPARRGETTFSDSESDADGESGQDVDGAMFPPNERERRKDGAERPTKRRRLAKRSERAELTEEEINDRAKARKAKEKERNSKIKSQLYVTAEDDESDDERDAEFFRLEEESRKKMAGIIRSTLLKEAEKGAERTRKPGVRKRKRKQSALDEEEEDDEVAVMSTDSDDIGRPSREEAFPKPDLPSAVSTDDELSDSETRDGEQGEKGNSTPSTSPASMDMDASLVPTKPGDHAVLKETPVNLRTATDSDDEDDTPVVKPMVRSRLRAGFIIDSDSD